MASATRNIVARSIHIKIHPTARTFPERREVLRVLERFGEVEMFRSLKYDPINPVPNAFLSIFSTEEAAQAALEASPIRYRLITDPFPAPPSRNFSPELDASPSSSSLPSSSLTTTPAAQPLSEQIFELRISPSTHPHRATIVSSPLHSTYMPVSLKRSPIASDLAQRIPPCIPKAGLVDWVTDSASPQAGSSRRGLSTGHGGDYGNGEGGKADKAMVQWGRGDVGSGWEEMRKPWRVKDRERKAREKRVPWVMKGLRSRLKGEAEAMDVSES